MSKFSKDEIEEGLRELLNECLRGANQEGSIISIKYDEDRQECTVQMTVHIVDEDDFIGFEGY